MPSKLAASRHQNGYGRAMSAAGATHPERTAFEIPSLDGLRALSFFVVFAAHVGLPNVPGGFGVTVFFFLSGYLITTLLRREAAKNGAISFTHFYLRRALRILPPFYLILLLALGLTQLELLPSGFSWAGFSAQVLHYSNYWIIEHGWHPLITGTSVYWSLAVEEHFYLVFPALYVLLLKLRAPARTQHTVLLALCALVLLLRCFIVFGRGEISDRTYIGSDTRFDSMLFGCALAVWYNPALDCARAGKPSRLELAALVAGLGLLLSTFLIRDPVFRESARYTLQGIGLYPLFFVAVRCPGWGVMRLLNWRPLAFIGTLSYSLYLLHHVVIGVVYAHVHVSPILQALLALGISVLLALAMWRLVEQPCARLRSRLKAAPRAPAPAPLLRPE